MSTESRDERKKLGFARLRISFKNSWDGLRYSYTYEQSMIIHFTISVAVIAAAVLLKINTTEWILILLCIALVSSMELMNTAVEATVDLVTMKTHPLAKIAKDTASAAVGMVSLLSAVIGLIIFLPKIWSLF